MSKHAEWLSNYANRLAHNTRQYEERRLESVGELREAAAHIERLEEALRWYEERARECRRMSKPGDVARAELDHDGGFRARAALAEPTDKEG